MINIDIIKNSNNTYLGFETSGHSGYAEYGQDIVCSAISSATYLIANAITEIIKAKAEIKINDGYLKLIVHSEVEKCQEFIRSYELHVVQLQQEYPNYITVNFLEV